MQALAAETSEQVQDLFAEAKAEYRRRVGADEEIEIVDVVEDEPPPPPPKRPRPAEARGHGASRMPVMRVQRISSHSLPRRGLARHVR